VNFAPIDGNMSPCRDIVCQACERTLLREGCQDAVYLGMWVGDVARESRVALCFRCIRAMHAWWYS
jgi:hypothetical protein